MYKLQQLWYRIQAVYVKLCQPAPLDMPSQVANGYHIINRDGIMFIGEETGKRYVQDHNEHKAELMIEVKIITGLCSDLITWVNIREIVGYDTNNVA